MHNGPRTIFILFSTIFIFSCSPTYRFSRLVHKYPFLLETLETDSVVIRDTMEQDTQFFWNTETDTIYFNNVRVERFRDTFRFYYREKPCTTYINKTEIKPSKVVEKYIEEKTSKKGFAWAFLQIKEWLWLIIIGLLIILLIRK